MDPEVWTDGSLVTDEISGAASAGSVVYAGSRTDAWRNRRWEQFDDVGPTKDGSAASCRVSELCLVLCRLCRGLNVGALQLSVLSILGLTISRQHGMLAGCWMAFTPLELENDGDLRGLILKMVRSRGKEDQVRRGQVRELDRDGNNRADC